MACQVKGAAVITGAGSGIGKATAISFAQNGIQSITLVDLNLSHLERSRSELRAQFSTVSVEIIQANVADEASVDDAVRKTVERFGSIDIGINCAGISGTPTPTDQMTLAEWQKVIDVNQTGVWLCQRALIRQMLKQEWVAHLARDLEASALTFNLGRAAYVKGEALSSMSRRCSACVVLQGRSKFPITLHPSMVSTSITLVSFSSIDNCSGRWLDEDGKTDQTHPCESRNAAKARQDAKAYSRRGIRINAICPGYVPVRHSIPLRRI